MIELVTRLWVSTMAALMDEVEMLIGQPAGADAHTSRPAERLELLGRIAAPCRRRLRSTPADAELLDAAPAPRRSHAEAELDPRPAKLDHSDGG